ncbi:MAG: FGGY family carbohydrate kinase [Terrimicrobiaceae bacterium]|nr:FGGY family carbohydrate kinase [Terrimicrobiaceae bacterium]
MSRGETILAIDAGTSSFRAARFDFAGGRVADSLVQRAVSLRMDRAGMAVLDAGEWLAAAGDCVHRAADGAPSRAVGMSCFWHSFLGVDVSGRALTPIYTWADSRCSADAAALRGELDEREIHAETGCMLRASYWPAKLRWLRRTEPALFRRVKIWLSPAEWLQWRLAGSATCAIGMATGTGLFDPTAQRWSERMLAACGIDAGKLLPISDEPAEWRGASWFPGIGDGAASNLGCGATTPAGSARFAAINIGTSAALRVMRSGRVARAPFGLFCYRVDAKRHLVGGAVSNAGNLRAWCARELDLPKDSAALDRALAARKEPAHGLTVLPFWTAERAPRWNEDDTGTIHGLRQSTTALDILQALTEAFYYRLAGIAGQIAGPRAAAPKWIVSGGGIPSRAALSRLANVLGDPVYLSPESEASLRGAAVLAIERLGGKAPPLRLGRPVLPEPGIHARYLEARAAQSRLERQLGAAER